VCASTADIKKVADAVQADPQIEIKVDVQNKQVVFGGQSIPVTIPATAHEALTTGKWDPIAELLENKDAVHARITALGFA
jgi:3-isopropylmalate/(R)-2-methylmalate dehydratase small subunit